MTEIVLAALPQAARLLGLYGEPEVTRNAYRSPIGDDVTEASWTWEAGADGLEVKLFGSGRTYARAWRKADGWRDAREAVLRQPEPPSDTSLLALLILVGLLSAEAVSVP